MKLAKSVQLDKSDYNVFPLSANAGEWSLTGTFSFVDFNPLNAGPKDQLAFKHGWLCTETYGRTSIVQVTSMSIEERTEILQSLTAFIFKHFDPPNETSAIRAAEHELMDMEDLCEHPLGTLLSIERTINENEINEKVTVIKKEDENLHAKIWQIENV